MLWILRHRDINPPITKNTQIFEMRQRLHSNGITDLKLVVFKYKVAVKLIENV